MELALLSSQPGLTLRVLLRSNFYWVRRDRNDKTALSLHKNVMKRRKTCEFHFSTSLPSTGGVKASYKSS